MNVEIYDTTLRDGAQSEGISYSLEDKIKIARQLDDLGLPYIEGGWPYSNPKDKMLFEHFCEESLKNSKLVAFGSTKRIDTAVGDDPNLNSLVKANTEIITLFGKSSPLHVTEVLKTTLGKNIELIQESVSYLKSHGKRVFYDAEHFFDAFKDDREYALKTIITAAEAGAECIILCDTNGGSLPSEVSDIITSVREKISTPVGIHAHNDCGLAVANSIVAVENGITQVQGTFNGYGERCGNADLVSVIPIIQYKLKKNCLDEEKIRSLTAAARYINEVSNMKHNASQPFVGSRAFTHKGGVHIDAMKKNSKTYEHIDPEMVGNKRRFLVSEISGKSPIITTLLQNGMKVDKKSEEVQLIMERLQELEQKGYQFDVADASFKLLVNKTLGKRKRFFQLQGFRIVVEKSGKGTPIAEASIRIMVKDNFKHTAALGDGPVNALDAALRKALEPSYPALATMHLTDYKVRVLDESEGTGARVRVLILCQDSEESWGTVGVSENIIEASWEALLDSMEYKLQKEYKEEVMT